MQGLRGLVEFYTGPFTKTIYNIKLISQYNMHILIGTTIEGINQTIVKIKNVYSPNITGEAHYNNKFAVPSYMNLYSKSNDDTSLIFSRNALSKFYVGNQITATFNVPNYLLNDGNIKKASVYGNTNYLLNYNADTYSKNMFESLFFNFIYSLNIIDNTNGTSVMNQIGANRLANSLWNKLDNYNTRLSKVRITYDNLTSSIIDLNISQVTGISITFSYQVSGNIIKIEYLSQDENTVYATFRKRLTGNNTISQTISIS